MVIDDETGAVAFLTVEDVLAIHALALEVGGGAAGVRDQGQVETATMAPRTGYYGSLAAVAAAYCFGLAQSRAFLDGNKRTGIAVAGAFLGGNGHRVLLDADEFESLMIGIADGSATREDLGAAFAPAIGGDGIALEDE